MNEVEVKILDINREDIESRLLSLGARKTFDGEMCAVYFDRSDDSLKKSGDLLRVRKEGNECVLTFKKFVCNEPAKIRKEFEVTVSDLESIRRVFEQLGFKEWLVVKKHRTSYELQGVNFELDKYLDAYDYIPEFLEVEARDMVTVFRYVKELGFRKEECLPWTFLDVAAHYSQNNQGADH